MNWDAVTAIASLISMFAFVATAFYVRGQLRHLDRDRYLVITNELFSIWQSREFMEAQLWLLHRLEETSWEAFIELHRTDFGELAFHRVGGFYDRVGTLVRLGLINDQEILSTIGAHAIAVWNKIDPLVKQARLLENSTLFDDFERLLPACHECYVPSMGAGKANPFTPPQRRERIGPAALQRRLERGDPVLILDVRSALDFDRDPRLLPGAIRMPPAELDSRVGELPREPEIIPYCSCPDDGSSLYVAERLREKGFRARALAGGFPAWVAGGLPVTPAAASA